jgi:putative spermidine/putrescine transport system ATP-binding protein
MTVLDVSHAKLDIRGLSKSYGPTVALKPTSLTVSDGEFLTLLGPSGSGKTTLLMMIAGLTPPSGGTLLVDGQDITAAPAHKRDIGVVFQNYALFPHLTVFENIAFPLRMRKLDEAAVKMAVAKALALVQLPHLAARRPRELSGGQQQRVAFARAIVFKPSLVLMDEPLGALDKKLRDELKLEIRKLHRELKTTIVYVTHDQDEAMLLSDRICLMNNAHIEQIGTPAGIYAQPLTRFAASFIGESNLLVGTVTDGAIMIGGRRLVTAHGYRLPAVGATVDVLVRPERIRIGTGLNELVGTMTQIIDLGGTRRITLDAGAVGSLTMVMLGGGMPPQPGAELTITVDAADIVPLTGTAGR